MYFPAVLEVIAPSGMVKSVVDTGGPDSGVVVVTLYVANPVPTVGVPRSALLVVGAAREGLLP